MEGARVVYKQAYYHPEGDGALPVERWGEVDRSVPYVPSASAAELGDPSRTLRRKALNRTWPHPQDHEQSDVDRRETPTPQLTPTPSPHPSRQQMSRRGSAEQQHRGSPTSLPPARVPCRGATFGCNWMGSPQAVFAHESACTLSLIAQRLFQLEAANNALHSKLEVLQQDLQEAEEWPIKFRELQLRNCIRDFFLDPLPGFTIDSSEMLSWVCGIPGKKGTLHEGAMYELTLEFGYHPAAGRRNKLLFPYRPPRVLLSPYFFHPNVYSSGEVGLPVLIDEKLWDASMTIKEILLTVQEFLTRHHLGAPVQEEPWRLATTDPAMYRHRLAKQAELRRAKGCSIVIEPIITPEKKIFSIDASSPDKLESPELVGLEPPSISSISALPPVSSLLRSSSGSSSSSSSSQQSRRQPSVVGGSSGESVSASSSSSSVGVVKQEKRPLSEWTTRGKYRVYLYGVEIEE